MAETSNCAFLKECAPVFFLLASAAERIFASAPKARRGCKKAESA